MVVGGLQLAVFRDDFIECTLPEVASEGEHIRFVHQREMLGRARSGQLAGEADAAFYAHAGIHRALSGYLVRSAFAEEAAFACVSAFRVFTHHEHVYALLRQAEGAQVRIEIQLKAHLQQQASFYHPWRHSGCADCAEIKGVQRAPFFQHRIGKDRLVAQVAFAA